MYISRVLMAAALLTGTAGFANAQAATQSIVLSASVGSVCTIGGGVTGNLITATPFGIGPNGVVSTAPVTITGGAVSCNQGVTVALTSASGGMSAPSITQKIHYSAIANITGVTGLSNASINTAASTTASGATAAGAPAASGTLSVTVTPIANISVLPTATYTDTLTVTLTPTP